MIRHGKGVGRRLREIRDGLVVVQQDMLQFANRTGTREKSARSNQAHTENPEAFPREHTHTQIRRAFSSEVRQRNDLVRRGKGELFAQKFGRVWTFVAEDDSILPRGDIRRGPELFEVPAHLRNVFFVI